MDGVIFTASEAPQAIDIALWQAQPGKSASNRVKTIDLVSANETLTQSTIE